MKKTNQLEPEIEISLDRETYTPGQTVQGHVFVRLRREYPCRSMYLIFQGEIWALAYLHQMREGKWVDSNRTE